MIDENDRGDTPRRATHRHRQPRRHGDPKGGERHPEADTGQYEGLREQPTDLFRVRTEPRRVTVRVVTDNELDELARSSTALSGTLAGISAGAAISFGVPLVEAGTWTMPVGGLFALSCVLTASCLLRAARHQRAGTSLLRRIRHS